MPGRPQPKKALTVFVSASVSVNFKFKCLMSRHTYSICVGNVGNMSQPNKKTALKNYAEWVNLSKGSQGRASGEDVTLFINGEPAREYFAPITDKF